MKARIPVIAAALAMFATIPLRLSAAVSFDGTAKNDLQQEISSLQTNVLIPAAGEAARAGAEWTIMVFVNGKNNLEEYALKDMNEMELVGSSDKVNVVVEVGRIAGHDSSDGDWKGVRRYLIKKDADTAKVASPLLQDLGQLDMGDPKSVIDFVKWARAEYPARRYMLILWNHGSGWTRNRGGAPRGISYDDETQNNISTPGLGQIMRAVGKIDVFASDACLMQMPEVDYEIKDYVDYIVGSAESEPEDGYIYNTFLGPIVARPSMSAFEVGQLAVTAYSDHYGRQAHTQSLVSAAAMNGMVPLVNAFVKAAMAANEKKLILAAREQSEHYSISDNKDIWHFLSLYAASSQSADVKAAAKALQDYISDTLVLVNRYSGSYYSNAHGLAVYMPIYPTHFYKDLAWSKDTLWDDFLYWYVSR